jgi:hypothetical protein
MGAVIESFENANDELGDSPRVPCAPIAAFSSKLGGWIVGPSRKRRATTAILILFMIGCVVSIAGCPGGLGSTPKVYSGGGPLPEESEVIEKLSKMPKTGRYAPEPPSPKSTQRARRARKH